VQRTHVAVRVAQTLDVDLVVFHPFLSTPGQRTASTLVHHSRRRRK
jgi:hypothetical protein